MAQFKVKFLDENYGYARAIADRYGVDPALLLAISAHETNWGRKRFYRDRNDIGQGRIRVRPSDLLMLEQDRVIDPLRLDVVLTELESGERTRFGPFSVQAARRGEVW
jgi:hypothetical protein